jgi:K(+)-stimulated pyrophosphate-energized sodium pump
MGSQSPFGRGLSSFGERLGIIASGTTGGGVEQLTTIMLSFAMGASTQALFARVGGGIYTKAADVGADLVGKVEAGIPEDDARNPATIADNVGDNVGDVAGMGADLYESYYGSILSAAALGAAAALAARDIGGGEASKLAMALAVMPIALAGLGILASIVGIFAVRTKEDASFSDLLRSLGRGVNLASVLIVAGALLLPYLLLSGSSGATGAGLAWWGVAGAIVVGLLAGLLIAHSTERATSYEYEATRSISRAGLTGPATVVIAGVASGMRSTWGPILAVVVSIIAAFVLCNGPQNYLMGLYGVAIAAVGMLATLGITLATDAYGPIADNAGGNAEMSGQPPHVRHRTDMLDSLGNTTAATGKGFAIGSAALTALALVAAYIQVVQQQVTQQSISFVQSMPAGQAEEGVPFAVYEGYGKFAIVNRGMNDDGTDYVDGGMLIDRTQMSHDDYTHLIVGSQFKAASATGDFLSDSRAIQLEAELPHGDHSHTYSFTVISSRNGSIRDVLQFYDVTLTSPQVTAGLFIGVLLAFLFCAMTMSAVGRAAFAMMSECRRQFGIMRQALRAQGMSEDRIADPEHWPRTIKSTVDGQTREYPDPATCVSISTAGAQREMIVPSLLAILVPLAVGLVLGVAGVMGMLAGGLSSGFALAIFMANAGGAWDNAKKFIESFGRITADQVLDSQAARDKLPIELRDALLDKATELRRTGHGSAYVYGKGSDDHKAAVVGDTIGDPFKDTSGPSLNILIKLISIVSVVFAGLTVKYGPVLGGMLGLD